MVVGAADANASARPAPQTTAVPASIAQFRRPPAPPRAPEAIYVRTCGYCHGAHVAPIIRGRGLPAEMVELYVRTGPRGMPAFRPTEISPAELKALAVWVSQSKADPNERAPLDPIPAATKERAQ
ncbi:cytochrome c [Novosphingobium sp. FSY-8]|uniref:Cytochrome c n=2 Tax=Novosphingobium ovatum TaxID=1908523 RepID=A0ABW9XIA4_9SPHN|nr:cytochrome c [Novosphingobium ovatum]